MNIPASHDNYFGFDGYKLFKHNGKELSVIKNEQRFKFASGNIDSGSIKLYGIA